MKNIINDEKHRRTIEIEAKTEKYPLEDIVFAVPRHLETVVPKHWLNFVDNCKEELEEVFRLKPGEYKGSIGKS